MSYNPDPPACEGCGVMGAHRTLRCPYLPCSYCRAYGTSLTTAHPVLCVIYVIARGMNLHVAKEKIFHHEIPGSASRKRGSSGPSQQPSKQQTVSFTSRYISPRPQSQAAEANGNNLVRVSASSVILNAKRDPGGLSHHPSNQVSNFSSND